MNRNKTKQNKTISETARGILIVFGFMLVAALYGFMTGCKEQITIDPVVSDTQVESVSYSAFKSLIDGTNYFVLDTFYTCTDGVLYLRPAVATGAYTQVTGNDNVADTCNPQLFTVTTTMESLIPIYGQ